MLDAEHAAHVKPCVLLWHWHCRGLYVCVSTVLPPLAHAIGGYMPPLHQKPTSQLRHADSEVMPGSV